MLSKTHTTELEFVLLGLTSQSELQVIFFMVFLVIYLITQVENLGLILLIKTDSLLHTPMYFFLSHLSFVDLCYSTNLSPQMLVHFLSEKMTISSAGCFMQFLFFIGLVITEFYILAAVAVDRFVANCYLLQYGSKMSKNACLCLVAVPYTFDLLNGLFQTVVTFHLSFCSSKTINNFYCADPPLIMLSCSDTYIKEMTMFIVAGFTVSSSLLIILISYILILAAILRICFAEGRHRAFSTCDSRETAVIIFSGTLFSIYLRRPSKQSLADSKIIAVFYSFVSPIFNPLIYSLRNKDVIDALKKVTMRKLLNQMAGSMSAIF
ncbi:olfactory receptor 5M10-like [Tachyglossus aculeatus]|uniref:olfactory receptor 5M10-like n=1 Tax=Tachyglossus aculeatus TaxID=9261 RepID=UPI0018F7C694|nr:olfactory receptor 5M10-like [Tachyglossus aculeatus]